MVGKDAKYDTHGSLVTKRFLVLTINLSRASAHASFREARFESRVTDIYMHLYALEYLGPRQPKMKACRKIPSVGSHRRASAGDFYVSEESRRGT